MLDVQKNYKTAQLTVDNLTKLKQEWDAINSQLSDLDTQFVEGSEAEVALRRTSLEQQKNEILLKLQANYGATATNGEDAFRTAFSAAEDGLTKATDSRNQLISKWEGVGAALSTLAPAALDLGSTFLRQGVETSETEDKVRTGVDTLSNFGIESGNPYLMAAGLVTKTLGLGYDAASKAFGPKTMSYNDNIQSTENINGSYTGATQLRLNAKDKADKQYSLFSSRTRDRDNDAISEALAMVPKLQKISAATLDYNDAMYSMSDFAYLKDSFTKSGGWDWRHALAARQGTKLNKIDVGKAWAPTISTKVNIEINRNGGTIDLWTPSITVCLKNGGKTPDEDIIIETDLPNLIPEGSLHKNRHHLDDTGFDDSKLTKKGIPVVDINGELLAEIELNEIIFNLEVTKKLEELYREFYKEDTKGSRKEDLALLAGKLLHDLIINNTDDRTGLINSLKKGGTLPPGKVRSLQELIEEAKRQNPRFILRLSEPVKSITWTEEKVDKDGYTYTEEVAGTHLLGYVTADDNAIVFPMILEVDGKLTKFDDDDKALGYALRHNNILIFPNEEEAKLFTENYKEGWPEFFKNFKEGGEL